MYKNKNKGKVFIIFITFCNSKRNLKVYKTRWPLYNMAAKQISKTKNMKIFLHLILDIKMNFLVLYFGIKLNHLSKKKEKQNTLTEFRSEKTFFKIQD